MRPDPIRRRALCLSGVLAFFGLLICGTQAVACEAGSRWNARIEIAEDGSFERAGPLDLWSGQPVQAIGNDLFVQRQLWSGCYAVEILLLSDCAAGRAVDILGKDTRKPGEPVMTVTYSSLDLVLAPGGPLTIREGETFDQIVRNALSFGVDVQSTLNNYEEFQSWDRPDPFVGCEMFYPDSAGARR